MDYTVYAPIGEQMESGYKTKDIKAEVKKNFLFIRNDKAGALD